MMTGTGAATFPTSSSVCIIFFILACKTKQLTNYILNVITSIYLSGYSFGKQLLQSGYI